MGVLDELRKKADEKKAAEQQQAINNEQLEQIYQTKILPRVQVIFDSFREAIDYLNFLEEPIQVDNYCVKFPQFGSLFQSNYKINTDGRMGLADYNRLMQVNVSFFCQAPGEFSYRLESQPLIEKEIEFLHSRKLSFDWKHHTPIGAAPYSVFTVQRKVPVAFRIAVDYKQSNLKVLIKNHEDLQSFTKTYTPEELNDDFVDALLSYFLRRDNRLVKVDELSAEFKNAIKAAVQNKVASYQQKYGQMFPQDNESNLDSGKKNSIKLLFSKFKKS
jgi:hypothetical protein